MEMKIKFLGPNDPALDAVQTAIGKLTDVDVELEIIPWAEYRDVLMQSLQAGESPHHGVYVPGHVWIPEFAAGGLIEDLTPLLGSLPEETLIAYDQTDILEVVQDEAKYLGKQYMVPTFTDGHVFFYRSDKITLDDDSDVPTITPKEINNLAEKVDTSDGVFVLALKAHPSEIFFDWLPHFLSAGGVLLDADFQPAFANDAGIRALEQYCQLRKFCPPNTHEFGNEEIADILKGGKAALVTTWGGQAGPIFMDKSSSYNHLYKAALFPQPCGGTWGITIPTNQPEDTKLKALEVALLLNSPAVDVDIIEKAGSPIRKSSYTKDAFANYSWLKAQREMMNRFQLIPKHPQIGLYLGALTEAIYTAFTGAATPSVALQKAAQEIQNALND